MARFVVITGFASQQASYTADGCESQAESQIATFSALHSVSELLVQTVSTKIGGMSDLRVNQR